MGDLRVRIAGVLAPHDRELFRLLDETAASMAAAGENLEELVHFFPGHPEAAAEIARHVISASRATEALRLTAAFVTPIEREDLDALASHVEDFTRSIGMLATLLEVYGVDRIRHEARRITPLLAACGRELGAAMTLLRMAGDVQPHTAVVRELVTSGESHSRAGLADLFNSSPDAIELVRWKDIFDRLESALDDARRMASTLDVICTGERAACALSPASQRWQRMRRTGGSIAATALIGRLTVRCSSPGTRW
jgi:uncharacterized protein Yka (UPF0111/DUF47 family)